MGSHNSFTNYPNVFCFIFLLQLFFGNIPLNFKNYVRPAGIRDDHTNPQMRSIVLSSKHVSLWQRKRDSKLSKLLLRELPYNTINIVYAHGQFNNN